MAKTPKNPKSAGDKVKPSEVQKMPKAGDVRDLAQTIRAALNESGELSKDLSEIIAAKKSELGIHPGALKRVEAWYDKAKATDRGLKAIATELAHLDFYRDVLGLTKLLESQGEMFARPEAGETEQADDGDPENEKSGTPPGEKDLRPTHMRQPDAETPPTDRKH